jgi:hypothetical protein
LTEVPAIGFLLQLLIEVTITDYWHAAVSDVPYHKVIGTVGISLIHSCASLISRIDNGYVRDNRGRLYLKEYGRYVVHIILYYTILSTNI